MALPVAQLMAQIQEGVSDVGAIVPLFSINTSQQAEIEAMFL